MAAIMVVLVAMLALPLLLGGLVLALLLWGNVMMSVAARTPRVKPMRRVFAPKFLNASESGRHPLKKVA